MWINLFIQCISLGIIYNIVSKRKSIRDYIVIVIISLLFSTIGSNMNIWIFFINFMYGLVLSLINKEKILDNQIKLFMAFISLAVAESILTIMYQFLKINITASNMIISQSIINTSVILLIYSFNKKMTINFIDIVKKNIKIFIMVILQCFMIFFLFQYINTTTWLSSIEKVLILLSILSFILVGIFLFVDIFRQFKKTEEDKLKSRYNEVLEEYFEKMRADSHEYKNHLNAIYGVLQVGDYDQIKDLVKGYIQNVSNEDHLIELSKINNQLIRALIYSKISYATSIGINFKYYIKSSLKDISISDSELVIIMSNILNNAIEASSESDDKYVELTLSKKDNKYNIVVKNSVNNEDVINVLEMFNYGYSNKGDERGIGLYNVKTIVYNNGGEILVDIDENIFTMEINI
ncbi:MULTISPECIES: sensor histidine kinase [Clostridium]|uniref:sensor histidine kinase n=2 Tax=Clostridium TaxID=1485 RepID=UPI0018AB72B8|nr:MULTISPECIES: GHKL domain-containing protein [Clostridium]MDB2080215.1 GHKL domain-containing protein [Clostridium paraputrificum]MDU4787976.1 GHKL domain-containing protein [Clostridium sp.]MDU5784794.1 GHKL domain-containing protein [Clostridium sp.]